MRTLRHLLHLDKKYEPLMWQIFSFLVESFVLVAIYSRFLSNVKEHSVLFSFGLCLIFVLGYANTWTIRRMYREKKPKLGGDDGLGGRKKEAGLSPR